MDFGRHPVCSLSRQDDILVHNTIVLLYADNYPAPGKRPLSSISPVIMEKEDGQFHLIAGGSGGSRIFGAVIQVMLGSDWGMDISSAIEQPRVHHQLFPQDLILETTISEQELRSLKAIGHRIVRKSFSS